MQRNLQGLLRHPGATTAEALPTLRLEKWQSKGAVTGTKEGYLHRPWTGAAVLVENDKFHVTSTWQKGDREHIL